MITFKYALNFQDIIGMKNRLIKYDLEWFATLLYSMKVSIA